jgi:glycerol-3-phosphate acyltransferase PlsX
LINRVTLSVDAMGGDFGPRVTLPACLSALSRHKDLIIHCYGESSHLDAELSRLSITPDLKDRLIIEHCGESVAMGEKPSSAIRHRQDSSMCRAVKQVADKSSDACVSAGNTGALMAFGRQHLKMQAGIDRPAIITSVPTYNGHCHLLDLGANVDCSAEHLLQFAIMGTVLAELVDGRERPTVGLLNIGEEVIKGNEQVKLANDLIRQFNALNYVGYVEGHGVFMGKADVIVCDGFVGNIALKSSEGLAKLIGRKVRRSFMKNTYRRLIAWLAKPVLKEIEAEMDPSRRNGATLAGLQGIVVKSHGNANAKCFGYAIDQAVCEVRSNLPGKIAERLEFYNDFQRSTEKDSDQNG